jgi:hypothetical protein
MTYDWMREDAFHVFTGFEYPRKDKETQAK